MEFSNILLYVLLFILVIAIIILFCMIRKSGFRILSLEAKYSSLSVSLSECRSDLLFYQGSYSKLNKDKGVGCLCIDPYLRQHPRTPEQSYKTNPFENSKSVVMSSNTDNNTYTFKSIRDASKHTGFSRYHISKSCNKNGSVIKEGIFFKYVK